MRKLTYLVAATIDGFITGPANDNPDFFLHEGDFAPEQYDLADTRVFNSGVMFLTYTKR